MQNSLTTWVMIYLIYIVLISTRVLLVPVGSNNQISKPNQPLRSKINFLMRQIKYGKQKPQTSTLPNFIKSKKRPFQKIFLRRIKRSNSKLPPNAKIFVMDHGRIVPIDNINNFKRQADESINYNSVSNDSDISKIFSDIQFAESSQNQDTVDLEAATIEPYLESTLGTIFKPQIYLNLDDISPKPIVQYPFTQPPTDFSHVGMNVDLNYILNRVHNLNSLTDKKVQRINSLVSPKQIRLFLNSLNNFKNTKNNNKNNSLVITKKEDSSTSNYELRNVTQTSTSQNNQMPNTDNENNMANRESNKILQNSEKQLIFPKSIRNVQNLLSYFTTFPPSKYNIPIKSTTELGFSGGKYVLGKDAKDQIVSKILADINQGSSPQFINSELQNIPHNKSSTRKSFPMHVRDSGEETLNENVINEEKLILDKQEKEGQVLTKILEDVQNLMGDRIDTSQIREGVYCNGVGSWVSETMGKLITISKDSHGVICVNISHTTPPKKSSILNDSCIKFSGEVPFEHSGLMYMVGLDENERKIWSFVGECKTCEGIESITGDWIVRRESEDCKDQKACQTIYSDIWRKDNLNLLREKHLALIEEHKTTPTLALLCPPLIPPIN